MSPVLDYLKLVPALKDLPQNLMWLSYDAEAEDDVIGYTILHASHR